METGKRPAVSGGPSLFLSNYCTVTAIFKGGKIMGNKRKWVTAALLLCLCSCSRQNSAPVLHKCYKSRNLVIKFDQSMLKTQDGYIENYEIVKRKVGWVISSSLDVERNYSGGFKFVKSKIGNYDWIIDNNMQTFKVISKERDVLIFQKCQLEQN
ncbi:hypothetical protein [Rhizorhabdus sp. FW153]|uniref:hypothetical protein n=1 Tax=Rhizorhabdus sp. FW153 TaxID=3400216 RepID=UPI003CEE748B